MIPTSTPSPDFYASLLDSQARAEALLNRNLAALESSPEQPSSETVAVAILTLRRTTENRRKLMLMIDPNAFSRTPRPKPDSDETPRAWRHTKTFYPDPRNLYPDTNDGYPDANDSYPYSVAPAPPPVHAPSDFRNSANPVDPLKPVIQSQKSPPAPYFYLPADPYITRGGSDSDLDLDNDFNDPLDDDDDFDPELDADLADNPFNPVHPTSVPAIASKNSSSDFRNASSAIRNSSDPADPVILSKNSPPANPSPSPKNSSSSSVNSVALCENSSSDFRNPSFAIRNSSAPPDPYEKPLPFGIIPKHLRENPNLSLSVPSRAGPGEF